MRRLAPRLIFLVLLGGGLLLWSHLRKPRDLRLQIDLTDVRPGEVTDVDVVVRRGENCGCHSSRQADDVL